MDESSYRRWLSGVESLTPSQREEVSSILSGRGAEEEVVAGVEGRLLAERVCPHCQAPGATLRGRANGLRRLHCGACGRTFNALTGTSPPGAAVLGRKARRRGGKASKRGLSDEQVAVLIAADRSGATLSAVLATDTAESLAKVLGPAVASDAMLVTDADRSLRACARLLGLSHHPLNQTRGERVRGELHIQTVNSRTERFKGLLRRHRGVATRYLASYLNWFHLATLDPEPTNRTCLNAALGNINAKSTYA